MLCEYAHVEVHTTEEDRVVVKNEHWVALVPWWATWPFELLGESNEIISPYTQLTERPPVLPYVRHIPSIADLTNDEIASFADILSSVTVVYDNLFSCSFAYSMGIHQRPVPDARDDIAHLHLHFAPPLLRSASVRKFLVG